MEKTEQLALADCQRGAMDAFGVIYELYFERIYSFIFFKTLHKETAEDITSKTFIKAMDKIRSFDHSKGSFPSWLYAIARNSIIDHYRTRKSTGNIDDCWDLASGENIFEDFSNREQLEKIKSYLNKLKPHQRELVIMRIWQDLSYREISQITAKSEASLKMMFSRVMGELRKSILVLLPIAKYIFSQNN